MQAIEIADHRRLVDKEKKTRRYLGRIRDPSED